MTAGEAGGSEGRKRPDDREKADGGNEGIPAAEWTLAALGLLLFVGVLGFLGYEVLVNGETPPAVTVSVAGVHAVPGGHLVRIRAWNAGGSTAAEVKIEATLSRPGGESGTRPETREVILDYVPPQSERFAFLLFREDPPMDALDLRVMSYREP